MRKSTTPRSPYFKKYYNEHKEKIKQQTQKNYDKERQKVYTRTWRRKHRGKSTTSKKA